MSISDLQICQIKETEETKRKALELREKRKQRTSDAFWNFMSYDGTMAIFVIGGLMILAATCIIAIMGAHSYFFPSP